MPGRFSSSAFFILRFKRTLPYSYDRRILDAIDTTTESEKDKGMAYIYAILMFLSSVSKVRIEMDHCPQY